MPRRSFAQIIQGTDITVSLEYQSLYRLAFESECLGGDTFYRLAACYFDSLPFRGTAVDLDDFNARYGFIYAQVPHSESLDDLLGLCEYLLNLGVGIYENDPNNEDLELVARQISLICDKFSFEQSRDGDCRILVPKNDSIRAAAEVAPESVAYDLINYDYREFKGDLQAKRQILLRLLDDLEPKRDALKAANKELANELFKLANKYNIRHNNSGLGGKGNAEVDGITKEVQEEWYDTCRDLCAAAYLLLENSSQIAALKGVQ